MGGTRRRDPLAVTSRNRKRHSLGLNTGVRGLNRGQGEGIVQGQIQGQGPIPLRMI